MPSTPSFRELALARQAIDVRELDGGGLILRSPYGLRPHAQCLGALLQHWAAEAPDRDFLAQRRDDGSWRPLTYSSALKSVESIAQV